MKSLAKKCCVDKTKLLATVRTLNNQGLYNVYNKQ